MEATVASNVTTGAAIAAITKDARQWRPMESTVTIVARKVWLKGKRYNGRLVWVVGAGPLWVIPRTWDPRGIAVPAQVYVLLDANTGEQFADGQAGIGVGHR